MNKPLGKFIGLYNSVEPRAGDEISDHYQVSNRVNDAIDEMDFMDGPDTRSDAFTFD